MRFLFCHCERAKRAWQSTNLMQIYLWIATNLHACALQILTMTKIPCHTEALAEVSTKNGEWIAKTEFIWIFRYAQNDNGDFLLSNESSKCEFR